MSQKDVAGNGCGDLCGKVMSSSAVVRTTWMIGSGSVSW